MRFNIALLQIAPVQNNQDKNLEKGIQYCREAKMRGADLVLFPELWNIGFTPCPIDAAGMQAWESSAIDQQSQFFQEFVALARELKLNIAVTYLAKHAPKPQNTVSIINGQGEVVLNYAKTFICNFGREELLKPDPNRDDIGCDFNCDPGDSFDVCTLAGKEGEVKVGAMICADREFPEAATELMLKGAEVIVVPNSCQWDQIRSSLLQARAFENLLAIGMVNYPAPMANGHSQACTCVAWKDGVSAETVLVEAGKEEGVVLAEVDVSAIREFRQIESWRTEYRKEWRRRRFDD
jgi:predicted amidohydrolase